VHITWVRFKVQRSTLVYSFIYLSFWHFCKQIKARAVVLHFQLAGINNSHNTNNMGRAPCCEKMGLKKGLWTQEEDLILIHHINTHGHKNWRALPKQAGN